MKKVLRSSEGSCFKKIGTNSRTAAIDKIPNPALQKHKRDLSFDTLISHLDTKL